jgi:hypothetical protein
MAFGQASGPPAPSRQIEYLASLLEERSYGTFREARHRLGLTQRQAGGKFTIGEASELIDRLLEVEPGESPEFASPAPVLSGAAERAEKRLQHQREELIASVPAEMLAHELERRGWCCIAPTE